MKVGFTVALTHAEGTPLEQQVRLYRAIEAEFGAELYLRNDIVVEITEHDGPCSPSECGHVPTQNVVG